METPRVTPVTVILKTIVAHTVTYFLMGVLAFNVLDYTTLYAGQAVAGFLRPTSDPIVTAGPLVQPVRGLLFGVVFYWLRRPFFERRNGWLVLWATLVVIGILSPFVAAPGSLEGVVYTTVPFSFHLISLPEVLLQTLLFSSLLYYWINHPGKRWLSWCLGIVFGLVLLLPALGLLFG